jgi:hypothetical protein
LALGDSTQAEAVHEHVVVIDEERIEVPGSIDCTHSRFAERDVENPAQEPGGRGGVSEEGARSVGRHSQVVAAEEHVLGLGDLVSRVHQRGDGGLAIHQRPAGEVEASGRAVHRDSDIEHDGSTIDGVDVHGTHIAARVKSRDQSRTERVFYGIGA